MNLGFALTSAVTLAILRPKHDRNNALSSRLQLARLHRDLEDHPPPDPAFHILKNGTSDGFFTLFSSTKSTNKKTCTPSTSVSQVSF